MKVKILENKSISSNIIYPRLMINQEDIESKTKTPLIVMFINEWQGVVISADPVSIEDYRQSELNSDLDWSQTASDINFVPFLGEITLTGE